MYFLNKNKCFLITMFIIVNSSIAQIGIGTIVPNQSSIMDVVSTNKGILLPRVSLGSINDIQLDGTNNAATGLLIWNTNAAILGGSGIGYYYFNGTTWNKISTVTSAIDHDWYKEFTTNPPNNINDEIYTMGKVAIGKNSANYALDIQTDADRAVNVVINSTDNINHYGTRREITHTGSGNIYGSYNTISVSTNGRMTGTYNELTGNGAGNNVQVIGLEQIINHTGTGTHYGIFTKLLGSAPGIKIGSYQFINNTGFGDHYGFRSNLSGAGTGIQYGAYHDVNNIGPNKHYGTYNRLVSIGSGTQYGTYNDIGNLSNGTHYGNYSRLVGSGTGIHYGTFNEMSGNGTGVQYGSFQSININNNSSQYGTYNDIISPSSTTGNKYGSYNVIDATSGGTHYGIYSDVTKVGSYAGYFLGGVSFGTSTANNYLFPLQRGLDKQVMQTDATGNLSWVDLPNYINYLNRTGNSLDVATAGDNFVFTSDQTGITFPSTNGTPVPIIQMYGAGTNNSNRMLFAHSPALVNTGLEYDDNIDAFKFLNTGASIVEINLNGSFPLRIYGTARAVDFQSDTTTYPDYVFESYFNGYSKINDDYNFQSLNEIEIFIKNEGHLPGIKSFEDVKDNGMTISLAETSVANLEKIEELFIYAIEADKEIHTLSKKYNLLEDKIKNQQIEIDELKALVHDLINKN